MIKLASLTLCTVLLAPVAALAAIHSLAASIDDAQQIGCGLNSSARGTATATLNDVSREFSYTVTFGNNSPDFNDGLLNGGATQTSAHFHGPALPGFTAGIRHSIGAGSPKSAMITITSGEVADVLNGLWYVNIHSSDCLNGEIRGQLLVVTATPALPTWGWVLFGVLALCGVGLLSRRALLKAKA